jgi:flagellar protein FliL
MTQKAKKPDAAETPPPKKRGMMRLFILLTIGVVLGGGGLGAGLYASGLLTPDQGPSAHHPQLVVREGVSSDALARAQQEAAAGRIDPHVYQATYHQLENQFTSNLRGGAAFVQIQLGVSTYYDERVIENLTKHNMAIRSAILMVLSEQDPLVIATTEGKEALRQQLRNAVNRVLTSKEGFGGIEEVFFTTFVTQ